MALLQTLAFTLVAFSGTAVVLTHHPKRQVLVLSFFGMMLSLLFMTLQAADVALSELAVGTAALPLMLLATQASVSIERRRRTEEGNARHE